MTQILIGAIIFVAGFLVGALTLATLNARQASRGYVLMKQGRRHVWIHRDYVQGGIWDLSILTQGDKRN